MSKALLIFTIVFYIQAAAIAPGAEAQNTSAQDPKQNTEAPFRIGPATSALGGTGRTSTDTSEIGWLNPATLVHIQSYHFALSHQQSFRDQGDGYHDYAVMLADGGEDKIAAGSFSYIQRWSLNKSGVEAKQKDLQGAFGFFWPGKRFSVGASYRRLIHEQHGADITQDTFSLGTMFPLGDAFGVAFVGHDLAGGSGTAPIEARFSPSVAAGLHATLMTILQLRADLVRPLRENSEGRNNVHLGIESWFRPDFAFRLGGKWLENRDETWATVGVGFKGPRLSFGYSFEKETRTADGTRHTFDLWLPL
jgi:hypothetical protein